MRYTVISSLVLAMLLSFSTYATEQAPDRLVVDGDTLRLHALPLEQWKKQNNWEKSFFPDSVLNFNTGCWRAYIADWEVIDNRLYLTNIYNCDRSANVDLDTLFPGRVHNDRVFAEWFSDTVTAYYGKLVHYEHTGFSSIYEHELELVFASGQQTASTYFDNSLSRHNAIMWDGHRLIPIIDSLIDWASLPPIEKEIRVVLYVTANERGQVDSVAIELGHSEVFNQEALRVAHLITQLPVVYKRGQLLRNTLALFFVFTAEKQQTFSRLPPHHYAVCGLNLVFT